MKTFNYESNGLKYRGCFFDMSEYETGKPCLVIYGYIEDDTKISHISNITINVEESLKSNQVVIDNYANSNLISFLLDLGIVKSIVSRIAVNLVVYPVVELDLEKLREYCYLVEEELKYVS